MTEHGSALFAYAIAALIIVGGGAFLFLTLDVPAAGTNVTSLQVLVGGFMGGAVNFVFGAAQASRAVRSFQVGLGTPAPGPQ